MTQQTLFQTLILEKLGAPLIEAAGGVPEDGAKMAERLAGLLGGSVQMALAVGKVMDLTDNDPDSDSVRLGLTAISASLIARHYRLTNNAPDESEIKRLAQAMETILGYTDSFIPAATRLGDGVPADEHQVALQYIQAMAPVVNAVAFFPFGRAEGKLAQEVAARLTARATAMNTALNGAGTDNAVAKAAELGILRALAIIYVSCHEAETLRLRTLDDAARSALANQGGGMMPMEPVWQAFDLRAGMLETLAANAGPGAKTDRAPAPPAPPAVKAAAPPAPAPAPAEIPAPVAEAAEAAAPLPSGPPSSPMSFFKPGLKKPPADDAAQETEG